MSLAIYSTDYDPQRLHATTDGHPRDDRIKTVVGVGDRPLDLLVDTADDRILWSFRGDRRTTATRTGYFVADYDHTDGSLFRGFETALATLHTQGDWSIPYAGDLRWDAGFELWRLEPDWLELNDAERTRLRTHLTSESSQRSGPVEFAVPGYEAALRFVRAVHDADIECTLAVGTAGELPADTDIDLFLRPADVAGITPQSSAANAVLESTTRTTTTTDADAGVDTDTNSTEGPDRFTQPTTQQDHTGLSDGVAGGVLLVVLGFSLYSFVSVHPIHPITGLSAIGGLLGSALAYWWLTNHALERTDRTARSQAVANGGATRDIELPSRRVVVAGGTLLGFLFPTVFRVGGLLLTGEQWVFGAVITPGPVLISLLVLLGGIGALLVVAAVATPTIDHTKAEVRRTLFVGYLIYATGIFLATGLAQPLWYPLVPSL